jgi:hypothetical protein
MISLAIQKACNIQFSNAWVVLRGLDDVLVSYGIIAEDARAHRERYRIYAPLTVA